MRNIHLITVACISVMFACTSPKPSQTATLSGKVAHKVKEVQIVQIKKNAAELNPKNYTAFVDSSGNFSFKIAIEELSTGILKIENQRYDIALAPGDNLSLTVEGDSIFFDGKGAPKNNFLHVLSLNDTCSMSNIIRSWYNEPHELDEFYPMIDAYAKARQSELEAYSAKQALSPDFVAYLQDETDINSVFLNQYAIKAFARKNRIPMDSVVVPKAYEKNYTIRGILNDKLLPQRNYTMVLSALIYFNVQDILSETPSFNKDSVELAIIMDSLTGKTREHYLVEKINNAFSFEDRYDSTLVAAYNTIKQDKNYRAVFNHVLHVYNQKQSMIGKPLADSVAQTLIRDTSDVEMTLGEMLSKRKGKVVYIDMWSLGCGPCRKAMPFSKKLTEKLKDLPVDFVYLTVDKYSDKLWDQVYKVTETHHNQYRFEKGFYSKLHEVFNITYVPNYMIVDKNGNLVSYNAERPFSGNWQENTELEKTLADLAMEGEKPNQAL